MRRSVILCVIVCAVLALAACASAVSGSGSLASSLPSGPGGASASFGSSGSLPTPTGSPSFPAQTTVPAPTPTPTPTPTGGTDFTSVDFPVPSGFVPGVGYGQAVPLEAQAPIQDYIVPTGGQGGLDLIAVVVYVLPTPNLAPTQTQQVTRVKFYNAKLKVRVLKGLVATRVAGLPALAETVLEPGGAQNPKGYRYSTWFVFGATHLLQISCQTNTAAAASRIAAGCAAVVSGLKVV